MSNKSTFHKDKADHVKFIHNIANTPELTKDQTEAIYNFYNGLYKSLKQYEHLISISEENLKEADGSDVIMFKELIKNLEFSNHAYRPFIIECINLLGKKLSDKNSRQTYIPVYESLIKKLQSKNKCYQLIKFLNKKLSELSTPDLETLFNTGPISTKFKNIKPKIKKSYQVWLDNDDEYVEFFELVISELSLSVPSNSPRRYISQPTENQSTTSLTIDKNPDIRQIQTIQNHLIH